jgi:2-C-methyl-D-erythritol 4-phosphate cytidylyltransferase
MNFIKKIFSYIYFYFYVYLKSNELNKTLEKCAKYSCSTEHTNICLLLSAGKSTRFKNNKSNITSKQVYIFENKPLILYSLEILIEIMTHIIIITNSECENEINDLIKNLMEKNNKNLCKVVIITNDIDCRLKTIEIGLEYIKNNIVDLEINNIIIHDSARPFVPKEYFMTILSNTEFYSQYSLKLTNGLVDNNFNVYDRYIFFEICSPICIKYDLCKFIFENFIYTKNRFVYEPIIILKLYNIKINIIYGKYKFLKKITYLDDL